MSEIKRVVIRAMHADGIVREWRLSHPAGTEVRFTADGRLEARDPSGAPVTFDAPPSPGDLRGFIKARLDEDEAAALMVTGKRYPRWRVWLRRVRRGI